MPQPLLLPAAPYCPDMPDYNNPTSGNVLNVIARTPSSYGPMSTPAVFSSAISKRCQGAIFGADSSGNINGFAGDANDLYRMLGSSSSASWVNVSKSAAAYVCASDQQWKYALFGARLLAANLTDPIQSFVMGASTNFADLSAAAPKAKHVAVVKSFLFACNTNDPISGLQPQRAWWCGNGDPTNWPTPGTAAAAQYQSDYQDLLGDGGQIQGIVGNLATADAAIFQEHAIFRAVFQGGAAVFGFFPAQGVRGTPAPGSIAQLGGLTYFLGEDGFYAFDGTNARPIGANRVDKTFFADLDQSSMGSISSAIDPINKLYIILYPGAGHSGALCNKMMIYNWSLDSGRPSDLCWSPAIPLPNGGAEFLLRALSFGYTLDQLYTLLGYTLDLVPFPLSSRVWQGGQLLLGIFDSAHKLNFFTGSPLAATIDSSEAQPSPGEMTIVNNTRPILEGIATPSVSIGVRDTQQATPTFGVVTAMDAYGNAPIMARGRYIRAETTIPAATSWTHFSGVELEGVADGIV